jgi:hypothetical protein
MLTMVLLDCSMRSHVDGAERIITNSNGRSQKGTCQCTRFLASLLDCLHQNEVGDQALLQEHAPELGVVPIDDERIWPELGFQLE